LVRTKALQPRIDRTDRYEAINYRLKPEDIGYIFDHAGVDAILVDAEFEHLLDGFRRNHPLIPFLIDTDTDGVTGPYDEAVLEGLEYDKEIGGRGWNDLEMQAPDEEAVIALAYTSGTTAKPKGVEFTHRGAYMGAMGNVIESGLNYHKGRCKYLWTLPMFHAMGMLDANDSIDEN
jgi:acyl-CoA synthetase (AMP-forming)/AMP-acid ligase II